jgi:hypothetical protein
VPDIPCSLLGRWESMTGEVVPGSSPGWANMGSDGDVLGWTTSLYISEYRTIVAISDGDVLCWTTSLYVSEYRTIVAISESGSCIIFNFSHKTHVCQRMCRYETHTHTHTHTHKHKHTHTHTHTHTHPHTRTCTRTHT